MDLIVEPSYYRTFVNRVLPELGPGEVYFVSLAARNKYLDDQERKLYGLGRTEMFGRTIVRSRADFDYAMTKLGAMLDYKTTRKGLSIPQKALVVYVNINPSNGLAAYELFKTEVDRMYGEAMRGFMHNKVPNVTAFTRLERKMLNCYQKATGQRYWLDIDMDCPKTAGLEILQSLVYKLGLAVIEREVIESRGGWHILVNRKQLGRQTPLHEWVKAANAKAVAYGGEVVFNKNAMVPLPGTMQGGHLVTFRR